MIVIFRKIKWHVESILKKCICLWLLSFYCKCNGIVFIITLSFLIPKRIFQNFISMLPVFTLHWAHYVIHHVTVQCIVGNRAQGRLLKYFFPPERKKKKSSYFFGTSSISKCLGTASAGSAQSSRFRTRPMNITDIAMRGKKYIYILRRRHGSWTSQAKEAALSVCSVELVAPRGGWVNGQQVGRSSRCVWSAGNQEPPRLAWHPVHAGSAWTGTLRAGPLSVAALLSGREAESLFLVYRVSLSEKRSISSSSLTLLFLF